MNKNIPSFENIIERFSIIHRLKFNISKNSLNRIIKTCVLKVYKINKYSSWKDYYLFGDYLIVEEIKKACKNNQRRNIFIIYKLLQKKFYITKYTFKIIYCFLRSPFDTIL